MNTTIKLRYINTEYKVIPEEKMVIAFSAFEINDINFNPKIINTKGIAKAKYDEFDEVIGKRLARAKAEKEAYLKFRDYLVIGHNYFKNIANIYANALEKTKRNIINQKDYISKY